MRTITTSPHFHSGASTQKIMLSVIIALLPACLWGFFVFGLRSFFVVFVSISVAVLTEYLLGKIVNEITLWDLSAVVTGLLVGMNMSPTVPLFIPAIASFFAIAVVKWTFGGLGANWANPAIAGRIFVFFSFTSVMGNFIMPATLSSVELISSATPLSFAKTIVNSKEALGLTSLEILSKYGYPVSGFAQKLGNSTGMNPYNIDAFFGNIPGCIGEVSKLLIILGGVYLIVTKVITWHIPVSYLGSFSVLTWIFGGIPNGLGLFKGNVVYSLLTGAIILGAFFMATDMVTTPITSKGMIIFGIGCGFFTFLFRSFGSLPEATSVAILIMNIATPTIDKFFKPRLFGSTAKKKIKEASK